VSADATTPVQIGLDEGLAIVTLNRPDRLNALTSEMVDLLQSHLGHLADRGEVRAVLLRGNGRSFCAGADVRGNGPSPRPAHSRHSLFDGLDDFPAPTVAAIHGHCIGGGLELALCCDLRVVADDAVLRAGEVKLGVMPGGGGTVRLPRLIGEARAKELLYFGDDVSGAKAVEIGLANVAVPAHEVHEVAASWARRLATGPTVALRAIKRTVNVGSQMALTEALNYEAQQALTLLDTDDAAEGARAFGERRPPDFRGS
jgi:enoyl-CoA hydratase/carnithine racemase